MPALSGPRSPSSSSMSASSDPSSDSSARSLRKRPAIPHMGRSLLLLQVLADILVLSTRKKHYFSQGNSGIAVVGDDREERHRQLDQPLRSMDGGRIKEERIAGPQRIDLIGMAIIDGAGEDIDELDAGMPKIRIRLSLGGEA